MLGDEHGRSRVYASFLDVLRTVPTWSLWFRGFKDKNDARMYSRLKNHKQAAEKVFRG